MKSGMNQLLELQHRLKEIKQMGWIESHRISDTGIGKTFEDLLGISENNIQLPDIGGIEVKSSRSYTQSMVTLITFEPPAKYRNIPWTIDGLVQNLGETGRDKRHGTPVFHLTLQYGRFTNNAQKMKLDFRKVLGEECICVVTRAKIEPTNPNLPPDTVVCYPLQEIIERVQRKISGCLLLINADTKNTSEGEMFHLKGAHLYEKLSIENFLSFIEKGHIYLDIRFGRHPDGRSHNHGTAWRIKEKDIPELYSRKIDFLNSEIPSDLNCENKFVTTKTKVRSLDKFFKINVLLLL